MFEGSFLQHYNSAKDFLFSENYKQVKTRLYKLLKIKYALLITNEEHLEIKKIEHQF